MPSLPPDRAPSHGTDWEVGAVLKNKPNSQGTLFRGGSKFSSPSRYPRGYTPERLAEVKDTVKPTEWAFADDTQDKRAQIRRITDTVARSTVPTEHLSNLEWGHAPEGVALTRDDNAAGIYMKPAGHRTKGFLAVKPEYDRTSTTIHEIGHHVSHSAGTEHATNYSYENEHGGKEEAFADNYAQEHFRDRRGRQESRPLYGGGQFSGRIKRSDDFWNGYGKSRKWLPNPEGEAADEAYFKKRPEERMHPDGSYDEPLITRFEGQSRDHFGPKPDDIEINHQALPQNRW